MIGILDRSGRGVYAGRASAKRTKKESACIQNQSRAKGRPASTRSAKPSVRSPTIASRSCSGNRRSSSAMARRGG